MMRWAMILSVMVIGGGCASLNSVSMTRVPETRSNLVSAERSEWGVLGIYFDNAYVDEAAEDLRAQCEGGRLSGVFTKSSSRLYPLWTTRTVRLEAYCLPQEQS